MVDNFLIQNVEKPCKNLCKTQCKVCAKFREKLNYIQIYVYKLIIPLTFSDFFTTFYTTKSPLLLSNSFHYSTASTNTTINNLIERK